MAHRLELSEKILQKDGGHQSDKEQWVAELHQLRHQNQQLQYQGSLHEAGDSLPNICSLRCNYRLTAQQTWEPVVLANPDELEYPLPAVRSTLQASVVCSLGASPISRHRQWYFFSSRPALDHFDLSSEAVTNTISKDSIGQLYTYINCLANDSGTGRSLVWSPTSLIVSLSL